MSINRSGLIIVLEKRTEVEVYGSVKNNGVTVTVVEMHNLVLNSTVL